MFWLNKGQPLFIIDLVFNFFLSYMDKESGIKVTANGIIAKHYLRFWFWIDFTSVLPFDTVAVAIDNPEIRNFAFRLIRLARLLKLSVCSEPQKFLSPAVTNRHELLADGFDKVRHCARHYGALDCLWLAHDDFHGRYRVAQLGNKLWPRRP